MSILSSHMDIKLNDKFEKLHDEAFVYHNFLSPEEISSIRLEIDSIMNSAVDQHQIYPESIKKYDERLRSCFEGDIHFEPISEIQVRYRGDHQKIHIDFVNHMNPLLEMIVDKDFIGDKEEILLNPLAFIIYLNDDYEGGEISYPEYGINYKAISGDLVVHCVETPHGVNPVKSGIRYTHSNIIRSKFYVDNNLFKHHISNEDPYDPSHPDHFSYLHQFSTNERMKTLQESIVPSERFELPT